MELSKFENSLVVFFFGVMKADGKVNYFEFEDGIRAGYISVGSDEDPIFLVFSFPKHSEESYLMLSDGNPKELVRQMAALQEYNENEAHLCNGHTIPTDNEYLNNVGWYSYLITNPRFSYKDLPLVQEIDGRKVRFHLALPITKEERDLKIKNGLEALIDEFGNKNRDTITFDQR
ncbi:MAG: suppressor of fused domain protein [Gammaproteobacteria bacterium]|nr:suppressor of fused domain protein [Gammaproteobacteria bacterium]